MLAYHRFALSTAEIEDLLAERVVIVSREAVQLWVSRFGRHFADCIRRERPGRADKWHLDEIVILINDDVLDLLVLKHRSAKAAKRFLKRLIARYGQPRVIVTDKLLSYIKPIKILTPEAEHRAHKGLKNRAAGSHRPTDKREKLFGWFKSAFS